MKKNNIILSLYLVGVIFMFLFVPVVFSWWNGRMMISHTEYIFWISSEYDGLVSLNQLNMAYILFEFVLLSAFCFLLYLFFGRENQK